MRIFTVNRESGSSLKCKAKPVCTRSSCSRIAHAAFLFAVVAAGSSLPAQVTPSATAPQSSQGSEILCQPQVIGNRRIPKESVLSRLFSRQNNLYDPAVVERDFNSLWNTGYFEDIQIERVDTPKCVQLVIYVREKPTIRELNYKGLNAVTLSDVLERYKKAKVGVSVESQYDPTKIARAVVVLKDLLAEHGHQFATITPEVKKIPPAAVSITFNIKEGPTVKVGKIAFQGNYNLGDRTLRASMRNLKPIGVPRSIILENLFARTFDASKLDEDTERVRQAYRDRGYFKAQTSEPTTHVRDAGGLNPLTLRPSKGKRIDILMPVEEGSRYRLAAITFTGNKAVTNVKALRAVFVQKDGEWFNATLFGKGLDNLRKQYGALGYINMVANPVPQPPDEAKKTITLNIDIDEGKPFYVSRIEFQGNSITRDKVIRRELLLEEGHIYNSQLWELSILRLNQLNYFETLKADQDSESRQNESDQTVDLLLKLKEKGKNSIGLNGGISGLTGTFIGLNYETNNFLGLGETLSVQANVGDLSRTISFGFTEPYLRDKPISVGAQVFATKYDFNPSKSQSTTGASGNLSAAQQSLLTNYNTSTTGLTLTASEPLRHLFARTGVTRIGVSYSLSRSTVTTFNQNTTNVFQSLAFRSGVAGQNQLSGIITSVVTPSFSFSSLDRATGPHHGKDFNVAVQVAGVGGNVKYISPITSYRQFFPMKGLKVNRDGHNVLGYRIQFAHTTGFAGEVAPPTHRFYSGGEQDLRGFDTRSVSPYTFIPNKIQYTLTNPDGTSVPINPSNPALGNVQIPLPIYRMVSIGGDTQLVTNLEYRIPIISQVTFAFFTDFGMTFNAQPGQLRQSTAGQSIISGAQYGCPTIVNGACFGGSAVKFPEFLATVPGTNYVPRMSNGAELQVILPIINAPFRIFYAYNSLRLYESVPQKLAVPNTGPDAVNVFKGYFPSNGAGQFSYQQALQFYGADYILREPRKTFRLTVSTTF